MYFKVTKREGEDHTDWILAHDVAICWSNDHWIQTLDIIFEQQPFISNKINEVLFNRISVDVKLTTWPDAQSHAVFNNAFINNYNSTVLRDTGQNIAELKWSYLSSSIVPPDFENYTTPLPTRSAADIPWQKFGF